MARRPRVFIDGLTQHVVHRSVNRAPLFRAPSDYSVFLRLLGLASRTNRVRIHAYALMTNHVHVMATPEAGPSLSRMMQDLGCGYVRFFNRRYAREGTLWDGRFHASSLNTEAYWHTCLRYVELNPVRAGLAAAPEEYRWSSYRAHAFGAPDPVVESHPLFEALGATEEERQSAWRDLCGAPMSDEQLIELRHALALNGPAWGRRAREVTSV